MAYIAANHRLQKIVTVDLADQVAGIFVGGDVGGIFRKEIAYDLVYRIVALFLQCGINLLQGGAQLLILFIAQ